MINNVGARDLIEAAVISTLVVAAARGVARFFDGVSLSKRIRAVKQIRRGAQGEPETPEERRVGVARAATAGWQSHVVAVERTTTTTSAALSQLRTDETERVSERDGEKERQPGADPSDRPALTSTPSVERRRRHRRRQHRPVDSDVVTTMTTTNARILLLAPTPRRTRGWDTALPGGGKRLLSLSLALSFSILHDALAFIPFPPSPVPLSALSSEIPVS